MELNVHIFKLRAVGIPDIRKMVFDYSSSTLSREAAMSNFSYIKWTVYEHRPPDFLQRMKISYVFSLQERA